MANLYGLRPNTAGLAAAAILSELIPILVQNGYISAGELQNIQEGASGQIRALGNTDVGRQALSLIADLLELPSEGGS